MNNKLLLAGLAGGVAWFFIGWLVWGILLMETMRSLSNPVEGAEHEMPIMWALVVGNLASGFLYAFVFQRWAGISTFRGGMIAGAWLGGLIALSYDFMNLAFMVSWTPALVALDLVVSVIVSAVVGGIVGWVLGYGK